MLDGQNDVEIGVIPCEPTGLVSPCWVEVRPVIKRAFEQLWVGQSTALSRFVQWILTNLGVQRKEEYNVMIQELERLSTSLQVRSPLVVGMARRSS